MCCLSQPIVAMEKGITIVQIYDLNIIFFVFASVFFAESMNFNINFGGILPCNLFQCHASLI
jgi:hypothetical protein